MNLPTAQEAIAEHKEITLIHIGKDYVAADTTKRTRDITEAAAFVGRNATLHRIEMILMHSKVFGQVVVGTCNAKQFNYLVRNPQHPLNA